MHSFLKNTAASLLEYHGDLSQITVVLPNRRAGLFFVQHLGNLVDKPSWLPTIKTVEDVFYELAGQRPADDLTLIFELYKTYENLHPNPESFDKFYFWGELILKDFNDADQFLVNVSKLYHYLSEIKELESDLSYLTTHQIELIKQFWSSFEKQDRSHQDKFLKFWQILRPLYDSFQASLEVSGLAYSGKIYRKVAENLASIPKPDNHFVFVGFNAFTATEEKLIKHYISEFGATIHWDIDSYYLDDEKQEAGLFFRDYRKDKIFGPTFPGQVPAFIEEGRAKINTYAIPLKVNQANLVGSLLENCPDDEPWENTVVILPDEQLLFPVLHALPESIDKVNVTMGYPIKNAPIYAFLESILEMQRFTKTENGELIIYHKNVVNVLRSPYLQQVDNLFVKGMVENIQATNQLYTKASQLHKGGSFFQRIFQQVASHQLFDYVSGIMEELAELLIEDKLQRSYLYQCYKQLNRLRELFSKQGQIEIEREFFIRLFRQIFREVKLPFEGEPLQGIQLMGVLESRNLDFKRVIICNMNEDSFPPSNSLNSIIPFNIRRAFGLPVQEQNDAIYAYTFYRLLHRAEEVHMIYTTASDQGKAGEKSRYIQQMEVELGNPINHQVVYVPVDVQNPAIITIEKTAEILELLNRYELSGTGGSDKSLSPSALNMYLDCRLKFYFRYLAGIKEKEEVSEEVDAAVFGNIAHFSMENLYKGFQERKKRDTLLKEDFEGLKEWIYPAIEKGIRTFYHLEDHDELILNGQLAIVRDVLQKYMLRLLELDEEVAPIQLISMEHRHHAGIRIQTSHGDKTIALAGFIDRVDKIGETIRLIDYKSGADEKCFPNPASLFDRTYKKRNKAALQTLFYGLLYQATFPANKNPLKPGLFNFKEIFKDDFSPYLQEKEPYKPGILVEDYKAYAEDFERELQTVLVELYNEEVPFSQTDNLDKCSYCPYKEMCAR